ncbi:DNA recombination protein RmuC [Dyella sp. M7H15-1]|uniref:DNA recombination protein RmuC n=1 Tax=Dyella sp. M7H15-1 TaxID=2501295 RepID=UPI001004F89B|nr:DNA recombination protein RmuC [Dyella sp. M7H15-1]QAU24981.1 DNA recombination protein RmuC [Dyella sp. M7H15-1]
MSLIDILLALTVLLLILQMLILLRGRGDVGLHTRLDALKDDNRHLRDALAQEQRAGRGELSQSLLQFRGLMQDQFDAIAAQQQERISLFGQRLDLLTERTDNGLQTLAQRLAEDARRGREELAASLARLGEQQQQRLAALTADNEKRLGEVRTTLETQLGAIQQDNAIKLEQMRATVDEKLQSTLETRLGQSFKLVSERLEAVQRGLGEMQSLASGVGDLKRVLSNVKTRGILGEMQLSALLEQILTPEQYAIDIATVPGSDNRVEFAIRLPGGERDSQVWLPIDAKFPSENYERLLDAQQQADIDAVERAAVALERHIREEAKTIRAKYIAPPATTDFAILFLPTEGLYAEIIRRPGLFESLQREQRVIVAGPTTLSAILNSLQMGFRTLAIQQRSSEVWQLLGAVKNEFGKFGDVLKMVRKKLDEAGRHIDATSVRTRAIERKLRDVESLPGEQAQQLLDDALNGEEETTED